jgi:signal transduction histidine kinase
MAYLHLQNGKSPLLEVTTKTALVIFLLSGLPDVFFGVWETLWYLIPGVGICIVSYLLNRRGKGGIAGNVFAAGISLLIFLMSITSEKGTEVHLYYLPFVIGLPFLINYSDKRQLLAHMAHIALFWLFVIFYDYSAFILYHLPANQILIIGQVNMVLSVFFCLFFAFMIINTNRNSEKAILTSEEKLRLQNENLSKGNRELDKFVYSISHDLRSPVASILGLTTLAKQAETAAEAQEYTILMERSLIRMESYIQDILDYSRNTRLKVTHTCIDFPKEIEESVRRNQSIPDYQSVEVGIQINRSDAVDFYTDQYRLKIILDKIISNAFYYQRPDETHKQVQIVSNVSARQAVIRVIDNGMGIASEDIEKIFSMFYRSNVNKPGSGLGLYIARESANRIGGTITGRSGEGKGSEFTIILPNLGRY